MIKNLYIKFAFILTILLTIVFFYNFLHAEEIYFDLSEDSIELKTDFNGKEILYGKPDLKNTSLILKSKTIL